MKALLPTCGSSATSSEPATDKHAAAPSTQPNDTSSSSAGASHDSRVLASNNLPSLRNRSPLDLSDDSITATAHLRSSYGHASIRLLPRQAQRMY
jgi:hypothetical protein